MRLARPQGRAVEKLALDSERIEFGRLAALLREGLLLAEHLDPAAWPEHRLHPGIPRQRPVRLDAAGVERHIGMGRLQLPLARRGTEIPPERWRHVQRIAQMIMGLGLEVQRILREEKRVARKRIRQHGFRLDQPRVAEGGRPARTGLVDKHHRAAPPLQFERHRRADNAAAQNNRIRLHGSTLLHMRRKMRARPRRFNGDFARITVKFPSIRLKDRECFARS